MRRKSFLTAVFALIGVIGSASYLWSQIRARVELVVVPVTVRDSGGKLVTGLKREDFIVTEDGTRQDISNFSVDPTPLSAAIIIDDGMGANALKRLVPILEVMTSGFTQEDEMASFRYDHFVWKLSDFTKDPKVIVKSFSELAKIAESRPPVGDPGEPVAAGPAWLRGIAGKITIGTNGPPVPIPSAADRPKPVPTSRILHNAIFEAANILKNRPQAYRRMILLVSDGQVGGAGNTRKIEDNVELLLQNSIQVYSVATDYAIREGQFSVLSVYGNATGGEVFGGGSTRDMETAFTRITEQARHQYVLGYVSTNRPAANREIFREIKVRSIQPGHEVTHRKGYMQYPAK
jgi:VWFA-related protein